MIINKPGYLDLSILQISKTVMYEFWYDYVKPKYGEKSKLCQEKTNNFIVYTKTEDIINDAETRFYTPDYDLERPLSKGKIKRCLD